MKKRTEKKIIIGLLAILLAAPFVAADGYELWCLDSGEQVDFGALCNPTMGTVTGPGQYCVHLLDSGLICPTIPNRCYSLGLNCSGSSGGNTTIDTTPPNLDLFSPVNGSVYTSRNILLDFTADELVDVHYEKASDPGRWTTACSSCLQYSRERTFDEGLNEITFRATDMAGNEAFYTLFFNIDSREPRLRGLEPSRDFASGTFMVEFDEDNPEELILHYGNYDTGFREHAFDIETECLPPAGDAECTTTVDLSDYDGQQIEAYATLSDLAGNSDETNHNELDVDNSEPIINSLDYVVDGKKVTFTAEVTEPYLDEIVYIDSLESDPRERRLCSRLDNGICEKRATFRDDGDHEVTVIARDEAGNEASQVVYFFTDSREPKIRSTEPRRGFTSGLFEIEFEEENPTAVFVEYGNTLTGFRTEEINLTEDCIREDGEEYYCTKQVDLADYDGQEIQYTFTVTDRADQIETESEDRLAVDISFPVINSIDYQTEGRRVYFTIDVDEPYVDEITYIDNTDDNPRERRLCSRLDNGICEKKATFRDDGDHEVTIRVYDEAGHSTAQSVEFFTDSDEPRIREMSPDRGYASGFFEFEFDELNPTSATLEYGNLGEGFNTIPVIFDDDCSVGDDDDEYYCTKQVDLADYDGQEIQYTFTVTDRADQTDSESEDRLMVDMTYPQINSLTYELEGDRAEITISVTEQNLDEINYINLDDNRPRERRFCSRLDEGMCDRRIGLEEGINRIDFTVIDEAGNSVAQQLVIDN